MTLKESRLDWPDYMRAIAAIAVILLHVAAPALYKFGQISEFHWWISNLTDSLVRFCVPIFLMLTGALLLSRTYAYGSFLKRRFSRLLIPFLLWSIIYLLYNFEKYWPNGLALNFSNYVAYALVHVNKGTSYHLWYVYMILFFYFFFPFLSRWLIKCSTREILFYLLLWFVLITWFLPELSIIKNRVHIVHILGYTGYPVLGYLLAHRFDYPKLSGYAMVVFLASVTITAAGTYYYTAQTGKFYPGFYFYLSPNVLLASIGLFIFFKNLRLTNPSIKKLLIFISTYSYGIYLSHVLILDLLGELKITWQWIHPLVGIPVTTLLGLVFSTALVYLIHQLPFGSYISG